MLTETNVAGRKTMVTYAMAFMDALSSLANAAIIWLNLRSSPEETLRVCHVLSGQVFLRKQCDCDFTKSFE